jgi:4-alpha-glucanotransferase
MSDAALTALAGEAGLLVQWEDATGRQRSVSPDTLRAALNALGLACATASDCAESRRRLGEGLGETMRTADAGKGFDHPGGRLLLEDGAARDLAAGAAIAETGYHRLETDRGVLGLAIAPSAAPSTQQRTGRPKSWGLATQLYSLRGPVHAGFGDFAALADVARAAGARGAQALAISPVHALFLADPRRFSPYSPSSRDFLNPLFAAPGDAEPDSPDLIDWPAASAARIAHLRADFAGFEGDAAFDRFVADGGPALHGHALFETIHGHFAAQGIPGGWQDWPADWQDPAGETVTRFAAEQADELRFHLWLQWRAFEGLDAAQAAARAAGMRIGLIADLAVGLDPGGSHAWSRRDELLHGLSLGAPPDAYSATGQGWGITGLSPTALKRLDYEPFLRTVRAALAHAGGLRIDHALGLNRLWVIPDGASPLDGVYLRQPLDDLLRLLALEADRAEALIIAEDLGVVPPGLRDRLAARHLLGMRVLPFERDRKGGFTDPAGWTPQAAAMTSTHDMTPFAGWWTGVDLEWRAKLGADHDSPQKRAADRKRFWTADGEGPQPRPDAPATAVDAAVQAVARSACELAVVAIEDLAGLDQAPNLPGTIDEHPNWRRRLPAPADTLFAEPAVSRRIALLNEARPA